MAHSRETVRDALATLLNATLIGSGLPAQAVYGYPVADFAGQSPVVVVHGDGSERDIQTLSTRRSTKYFFNLMTFVLYTDGGSWNEDDAEDSLDTIESVIADTIADALVTSDWADIGYEGRSQTGNATIGGTPYRYEVTPISITVYHD